jgi:hypothetical protein
MAAEALSGVRSSSQPLRFPIGSLTSHGPVLGKGWSQTFLLCFQGKHIRSKVWPEYPRQMDLV